MRYVAYFLMLLLYSPSSLQAAAENLRAVNARCSHGVGMSEGSCAADLALSKFAISSPDHKGNLFLLSSLQGKVVLVHFWATWCEPCRVELPLLIKLAGEIGKSGVEIIIVSIDENPADLAAFLKKEATSIPAAWPMLWDDQKQVSSRYGTTKVPESFIIDKNGRIVDKIIGSYPWDDRIMRHYLELLANQ